MSQGKPRSFFGRLFNGSAFRCRDDEPDAAIAPVTIRELLSLGQPANRTDRAVRKAQLEAVLRLVPGTIASQLLAVLLVAVALADTVPLAHLLPWFGAAMLICAVRGLRAWRLRADPGYAARKPARLGAIMMVVAALAMLWLVPFLVFFDSAHHGEQMMLLFLGVGLLSAGSFTLGSSPPVAITYIWILTVACVAMTLRVGTPALMIMAPLYSAALSWAVLLNARQFINHVRGRLQLQEQGELVKLLREFQASGSGGLWELDSELRVTHISIGLAEAIGHKVNAIVGLGVRQLLDPRGRIADISTGMRTLFEHLEAGLAFRDIAIPGYDSDRWWSLSGKPMLDESGDVAGWRGVGSDITALRLSGADAIRAARSDPLTGLANRLLVRELLEEALLRQLDQARDCALLLVDLDRFKLVNDTLGHAIGDRLLCEVARRLEEAVGDDGQVGRLGGDEFALVWTGDCDQERLTLLAGEIGTLLSRGFRIGAASLNIGATIGIARGPADGRREEQLMRSADLALYRAKEDGRGGFAFYEHQMFVAAEDHRTLENDVRDALNANRLRLAYQPIVDASTGAEVGREALLRWAHPERGDIPPDLFVPIIEDAGLIHQIGDWVIREACAEAASWDRPLRVAVNISAAQLTGGALAATVFGTLAATGLAADRLELEVTESVFLGDDAATIASLDRLRALGVRLVLDDFGKGYSSFGYLSRAQFAKIKIDQSFVRGAADGVRESVAIVNAILALARGLNVETTAEGVESAAQAEAMRALGCNQLQGFHFGRPAPAAVRSPTAQPAVAPSDARRRA